MTTNDMIYKTITTKLTKEPIYKSVLEDLGYEVYDSDYSSYNNWAVKNKDTGFAVVLSKGSEGKRTLYDPHWEVECSDIRKVDFVNLLIKRRDVRRFYNAIETHSDYYNLRHDICCSKSDIKYYKDNLDYIKEKIEALNKDLERCKNQISDSQKKLNETREKVAKLKIRRRGIVT